MEKEIYLQSMNFGNGDVNFYVTTSIEKIKKYITKRGCYSIKIKNTFLDDKVIELTLNEFKKLYY